MAYGRGRVYSMQVGSRELSAEDARAHVSCKLRKDSSSHGGGYEDRAFWDVAPCSLIRVDLSFRGAYCLHHHGVE
jgi:hypothetical protein